MVFPVLLISFLGVALAGLDSADAGPRQPRTDPIEVLATVNGTEIDRNDVELAYEIEKARRASSAVGISPADVPLKKKGIMLQLIQIELLYQEAGRRGFSIDGPELDEVVGILKGKERRAALPLEVLPMMTEDDIVHMARRMIMLDRLRVAVAAEIKVTDNDAKEAFARNRTAYLTKEEVDIRQVLLKIESPEEEAEARKKAEMVCAAAEAGEEFADLARQYSDDPSSMRGGKIGTYRRGMLANAFEKIVFSTPVGEVTAPIRTRFGFHVIKVEAHRLPRQPEFEEVRDRVIADFARKRTERKVAMLADRLRAEANVWYKDRWDTDAPVPPGSRRPR